MMEWRRYAEVFMYIGTFLAPFYFILPTNAGLYEILMVASAICLLLSNESWRFPDSRLMGSLILILIGYTLSIVNSVNYIEALKFPLQFGFIVLIQVPVLFTLTRTTVHFRNHAKSLFCSLTVISFYFTYYLIKGVTKLSDWTTLFYNNPNTLGTMVFFLLIPSTFLVYEYYVSTNFNNPYSLFTGIILIGILILGSITMFSSLSRRIYPGLLVFVLVVYSTNFLRTLNINTMMYNSAKVIFIIIPISIAGFFLNLYPESLFWRIEGTITGTHSGSGIDRRMWYNEVGMRVSIDQIPFGTGYNNYHYFQTYYVQGEDVFLISEPHNLFIEAFAEGGVIAGIGITMFFGIFGLWLIRILLHSSKLDPVAGSFVIATLGFIAIHMVGTLIIFRLYWLMVILSIIFICEPFDENNSTDVLASEV